MSDYNTKKIIRNYFFPLPLISIFLFVVLLIQFLECKYDALGRGMILYSFILPLVLLTIHIASKELINKFNFLLLFQLVLSLILLTTLSRVGLINLTS